MIAASHRLSRREIPLLIKTGRRSLSRYFSVFWREAPTFKASISIPKPATLTAVRRNFLKRQIKTALLLKAQSGWSKEIVVLVKRSATQLETEPFNQELQKVLSF